MKWSSSLMFALCVLSFSILAAGQASQTHSSTPAPPSTTTRPDSIQDSGLYGYWTNLSSQGRVGGALTGKVAVEGEPLLWNPIQISVLCKGATVNTTRTDPKGYFQIVVVPVTGAANQQQQLDTKRQMETQYEGCTVQAEFSGFRSTSATITQRNLRDDPDLGTLTLSRVGGRAAGTAVSSTIDSAPAAAVKDFEKARTELIEQKPDKAEHDLEKAVQAYPGFAEAWYQLGRLQRAANSGNARGSFAKAAAADPQFVLPYEQLAALAAQDQKWQEVVDNTNQTLKLDEAGTALTWYLNALGNFQLGKTDIAEASAFKSLTMDPAHTVPNTEQLLAVILAGKGDYAGALVHLRNCLTYLPSGASTDLLKQQIAQVESKVGAAK